ncbi:hypothetical protein ACFLQL_03695 [Verrucomicrobiota bacterium]
MENDNIIRSLLKVRMSISAWTGKVKATALEREAEETHDAERGTVDTKIIQLPEKYAKTIGSACSQLRTYWNDNTLPWEDGGDRIIGTNNVQEVMDRVEELIEKFNKAVGEFKDNYTEALETTKGKLAGLFVPAKFPSELELFGDGSKSNPGKYGVRIWRNVIPLSEDIRVTGLTEDQVNKTKKDIEDHCSNQIQTAVSNVVVRLSKLAGDIVERMNKPTEEVKYGTLLPKIKKITESLDKLNITGNADLSNLINQIKDIEVKNDKDLLSVNATVREEVKEKATSVLDALKNFGG